LPDDSHRDPGHDHRKEDDSAEEGVQDAPQIAMGQHSQDQGQRHLDRHVAHHEYYRVLQHGSHQGIVQKGSVIIEADKGSRGKTIPAKKGQDQAGDDRAKYEDDEQRRAGQEEQRRTDGYAPLHPPTPRGSSIQVARDDPRRWSLAI